MIDDFASSLYDEIPFSPEDAEEIELAQALAGEIEIGAQCIHCGCSNGRACVTENGACFWTSDEPPICSACEFGTAVLR